MRRTLPLVVAILLGVAIELNARNYDFSPIDRLLEDSLEVLAGIGGGATLLLAQDGGIIYNRSVTKDGRNFSEHSFIPIASASKWLAGAVIMALVDQGALSLDDRVGDYFSTNDEDMAAMTLRQLFSHTSGLPGNLNGPAACVADTRSELDLAECVDEVLREDRIGKPGQLFAYGSNSMHIAGRMAEIASDLEFASGTAWDTLFNRLIAEL